MKVFKIGIVKNDSMIEFVCDLVSITFQAILIALGLAVMIFESSGGVVDIKLRVIIVMIEVLLPVTTVGTIITIGDIFKSSQDKKIDKVAGISIGIGILVMLTFSWLFCFEPDIVKGNNLYLNLLGLVGVISGIICLACLAYYKISTENNKPTKLKVTVKKVSTNPLTQSKQLNNLIITHSSNKSIQTPKQKYKKMGRRKPSHL